MDDEEAKEPFEAEGWSSSTSYIMVELKTQGVLSSLFHGHLSTGCYVLSN